MSEANEVIQQPASPAEPTRGMSQTLRETIVLIVIAVAVFVGLRLTVQTYVVFGPSMQPNFVENERLIVNKVVYRLHEPQRGDVIVFRPPFNEKENFIKRVVGLPGEAVELKNGKVYVYKTDGTTLILDEPYISEPIQREYARRLVPAGEYYVLGDNRNNTNDSRNGWNVPVGNIIGKTWLNIWPPSRFGLPLNYPFPNAQAAGK